MTQKAGLTGVQWALAMGLGVAAIAGTGAWLSGAFTPLGEGSKAVELATPEGQAKAPTKRQDTSPDKSDAEVTTPTALTIAPPEGEGAPRFDVVRVDADGNATVAGRATPGSDVVIELDGQEAARLTAGSDGTFAGLMTLDLTAAPRVLRLRTADPAATYAALDAIVAPVGTAPSTSAPSAPINGAAEPKEEATTQSAPSQDTSETASAQVSEQTPPAGSDEKDTSNAASVATDTAVAPVTSSAATAQTETEVETDTPAATPPAQVETATSEPTTPPTPEASQVSQAEAPKTAPAVLLAGKEGLTVAQPAGNGPQVMVDVAIDAISYTETGDVQLAGRGKSEANKGFVRVYLDNKPITTSRIAADGNWRTALPDVDTGIYTLRVDQVDAEGRVVSRAETPFKREEKARVAGDATQAPATQKASAITVQPGNTLWAIAQENYGDGVLYVRLFEANREQIRNPDLIYPGQVFDIPQE
ncbi:LysM peptidoglycan-binding domain-containing protein [Rhodalgimonas zhirmunskyi]|uniref:LysM peptidoglycan-binding domain-containing protein n=1 Tax=Rhodalgimonas zhirmunskyi TaxID=2964767 RepID=A0AAJ1UCC4_9RHOB|nr:LysM peptidoglycan-binding domain-containing protein [Rhodoalgimonas zhirmunskyi]MDQ2093312.1 LysM peptidoglycan-binding domain-containing protein [Rhodoalgimonas zhirmunskyi]